MRKVKILSLVLAFVFAVSSLAGCSGGEENTAFNDEVLELEGALCSEEMLDLTIHMHYSTKVFPKEGNDDYRIWGKAAEDTNIKLAGTVSETASEPNVSFNTMLAGDVLPDIIHGNATNTNKAGMEGAMIPLEDLIPKYAPNIQKYFDEHPNMYKGSFAADGHLYYIPCIYEEGPAMGWYLRKDWLDKLGLEIPKTTEEYYNVLKAFREQDPNGNGKKDEVPFFDRHQSPKNLYYLFGVSKEYYDIDKDGKWYAPTITEDFKVAIKEISKWYAEGLIDQEIYSRGGKTREELLGNNLGGAAHDWFSSTLAFNGNLKDTFPGFELIVIDPPVNTKNEQYNASPRSVLNGNGWGISVDNKHVAETMKYFDYWYTEDGITLQSMGIEGIDHYVDENGERQYSQAAHDYPGGVSGGYMGSFGSREMGTPVSQKNEVKGMSPEAAAGFQYYIDKGFTRTALPRLTYTVEENKVISEKGTAIQTYVDEKAQGWIMGNSDIDAEWNDYVQTLKNMGIDEVVQTYQQAHNRFLNN